MFAMWLCLAGAFFFFCSITAEEKIQSPQSEWPRVERSTISPVAPTESTKLKFPNETL